MTRNHGRPKQHNLKQKETSTMKAKLTKMIMGFLSFACALVCLLAAMTLSTHSTAQAATDGRCDAGQLRGLYIWTFDGFQNCGGHPLPIHLFIGPHTRT